MKFRNNFNEKELEHMIEVLEGQKKATEQSYWEAVNLLKIYKKELKKWQKLHMNEEETKNTE